MGHSLPWSLGSLLYFPPHCHKTGDNGNQSFHLLLVYNIPLKEIMGPGSGVYGAIVLSHEATWSWLVFVTVAFTLACFGDPETPFLCILTP
jgi:hypothetical protein